MRTRTSSGVRRRGDARGVALLPTLIFSTVIVLVAIHSLNAAMLQEKMVGNSQDQNLAMQAAESGLRDAEWDVSKNISSSSAFSNSCGAGLCIPASLQASTSLVPVWQNLDWTDASKTRAFGSGTGSSPLPNVAAQPVYIVERLSEIPISGGQSAAIGGTGMTNALSYRITVVATGARPETTVMLQSIYVKP